MEASVAVSTTDLIDEKVFYLTPQWSPDGTMIVVHPRDADPPIWLVDSTSGGVRAKLSTTPALAEDDAPGSADIWSFERVLPWIRPATG